MSSLSQTPSPSLSSGLSKGQTSQASATPSPSASAVSSPPGQASVHSPTPSPSISRSLTVTIDEQILLFPFASVTVRVTVFCPTSSHANMEVDRLRLSTPQASFDPLSMSAAIIFCIPATANSIVISRHRAKGGSLSVTFTVNVQLVELALSSVAETTTVVPPTGNAVPAG